MAPERLGWLRPALQARQRRGPDIGMGAGLERRPAGKGALRDYRTGIPPYLTGTLGLVANSLLDRPNLVAIYVCGTIDICAFALGAPAERVVAVCITGQWASTVPVDERDGQPVVGGALDEREAQDQHADEQGARLPPRLPDPHRIPDAQYSSSPTRSGSTGSGWSRRGTPSSSPGPRSGRRCWCRCRRRSASCAPAHQRCTRRRGAGPRGRTS